MPEASTKWNGSNPNFSLDEKTCHFYFLLIYWSSALDGKYGKLYFAVLVNGERLANLIASTKTDLQPTPLHRCSPCLCLWNNDDDDKDAAEAGADVEALGQVKVVLAGEAVRKVDSSHPLTLHHLRQQQIKFPIKKKETKKNLQ